MAAKKVSTYLPKRPVKVTVPARVDEAVLVLAQQTAKKMGIPLCDLVEGAIKMFCDQAGK